MAMARNPILSLALGLALLASGCGRKAVPVKGMVLVDGKPCADLAVMFIPDEANGHAANGRTDANGNFSLSTFRQAGAFPGSYKVTIRYSPQLEVPPNLIYADDVQKASQEAAQDHKPAIVLPENFTRGDQTPLTHRVPEDGDPKFELKSEPPAAP